jgi:hypothetical protein
MMEGVIPSLPTKERIIAAKKGVVHFVTQLSLFSDEDILPLLFAAAGDQLHHFPSLPLSLLLSLLSLTPRGLTPRNIGHS